MKTRAIVTNKAPRVRRFWALGIAVIGLFLLSAVGDVPDSGERLVIFEILQSANIGTCTAAGTDNLAYGTTGYKLPSTAMAYKTKTASFPTYLSSTAVQSAIDTSFAAWDAATAKALFTNGGTTTALPSKKDGINSVGFVSLPSNTVGIAYGWASGTTLTEFGIALSTNYQWDLNTTASGDCGGVAMHGYAAYKELYKRDLAGGDKKGVTTFYGP